MKDFDEWFEDELEESPYDPSFAADHFMTETEYDLADFRYRDKREKDFAESAWLFQQEKIDKLEVTVERLRFENSDLTSIVFEKEEKIEQLNIYIGELEEYKRERP